MHIGIHTRWEILEDKLEQREDRRRTTATWQITRLPEKLSKEGPNYLFVAVDGETIEPADLPPARGEEPCLTAGLDRAGKVGLKVAVEEFEK